MSQTRKNKTISKLTAKAENLRGEAQKYAESLRNTKARLLTAQESADTLQERYQKLVTNIMVKAPREVIVELANDDKAVFSELTDAMADEAEEEEAEEETGEHILTKVFSDKLTAEA